MDVYFGDDSYYDLERKNGLYHVSLSILFEGGPVDGREVDFILDTGAYLSVISRGTAVRYRLDKLPKKTTSLFGFGGGISADFVLIPGFRILGKTRTDVPVLIPHDMYRINPETGEKKLLPDVLGLNLLEYYNYYIDTENDRIYLNDNPNPRFYSKELASGQSFLSQDYTEERDNLFENMTIEEIAKNAAEFERENPESIPQKAELI